MQWRTWARAGEGGGECGGACEGEGVGTHGRLVEGVQGEGSLVLKQAECVASPSYLRGCVLGAAHSYGSINGS